MLFGRWRGLLTILILFLFLLGGVVISWWRWVSSPLPETNQRLFVIQRGESLDGISRRLEKEGLIRNAFAFKIWMLVNENSGAVQAGSFRLSSGLTFSQLADQLGTGLLDVWVTFPEGWRAEQYALRLQEEGFEIDLGFWQELTEGKNGYLYPDTYLIPTDADEEWILALLENTFVEKTAKINRAGLSRSGLSWEKAIVMASLVQREVSQDSDLPLVAGVIVGRWREDWALQIDASVQFALASARCRADWFSCDWWPNNLTRADLGIVSLYNTYQNPGLPPGPICNPGLNSIEAVINFAETPYRYYISDAEGVTHFATSLDEHNSNVRLYLRK